MLSRVRINDNVLVMAHRGASKAAPENTLAAFRRAIEDAGIGSRLDRATMESLGFFVCVSDLEDELFRALGPDRFIDLIAAHAGEPISGLRPGRT